MIPRSEIWVMLFNGIVSGRNTPVRNAGDVAEAATTADHALEEFDKRFGVQEAKPEPHEV